MTGTATDGLTSGVNPSGIDTLGSGMRLRYRRSDGSWWSLFSQNWTGTGVFEHTPPASILFRPSPFLPYRA